jgi:hypothetical protein
LTDVRVGGGRFVTDHVAPLSVVYQGTPLEAPLFEADGAHTTLP